MTHDAGNPGRKRSSDQTYRHKRVPGRLFPILHRITTIMTGTLIPPFLASYGTNNDSTPRLRSVELDELLRSYIPLWHQTPSQNGMLSYTRVLSQNVYTYDDDLNRTTNTVSVQPANANGSGQTDSNGNPILTSRTESYAYDDLNRLSTVNYGDGETQGYGFDPMGNRLSKSDTVGSTTTTTASTFDAANRLVSIATNGGSASAVTSDADGNTLTDTSGRSMTWDSQNRMVSCTKAGVTSAYTYGPDGLRRSSTVNGVTTYYAYDGQTMIREMKKNAQNALFNAATYLQGPRGGEYRRDDTQTELDSQGRQVSVCRWYVYDGLGSVVGEVDPAGSLTSSPKYDVYGAVRGNAGAASSRQGFVGGLGHVSDSETGLVYMRARYYDPQQGRFASEDLDRDRANWFTYCGDNPINKVDPTGNASATLDGETDYDMAVAKGGFGALAAVLIIIGCYQLAESSALDGLFLAKGAKENTGKNQAENDWTNYLKKKYRLTKDEGRTLHDTITGADMSHEDIEKEAEEIVNLRNGGGGGGNDEE